jgi:hypothetical protein
MPRVRGTEVLAALSLTTDLATAFLPDADAGRVGRFRHHVSGTPFPALRFRRSVDTAAHIAATRNGATG